LTAGCVSLLDNPFPENNVLPLTTLSGENLESAMQIFSKAPPQLPCILSRINCIPFSFQSEHLVRKLVVRAFQAKWFDSYSWLHYDEANNVAFCYLHTSPALVHALVFFGWPDHCEEASDTPDIAGKLANSVNHP